jgi:6,7-dimethyl-8-ribityllumazine synthase
LPKEIIGNLDGYGLRIAIAVSRFNESITNLLLNCALETLTRNRVRDEDITVAWVPGSFELPLIAKSLGLTKQYDAVICLGAVVRGDTDHYEIVARQASRGICDAGLLTGVPTIFGVLTTNDKDQAMRRAQGEGGKGGNLGVNAAVSAIETARVLKSIKVDY